MKNRITISWIIILFGLANSLFAQIAGDYRTQESGNWTVAANWQKYNGSTWVIASAAPTTSDGVITIINGHLITVNSNITIDQVVVAIGGTLTVNSGISLIVANGDGDDLTVNGTLDLAGHLSPSVAGETTVINGTMNWSNNSAITYSEISTHSLTIVSGGTLNISGSEAKSFRYTSGSIFNSGTTNWTGTGAIRGGSNYFVNQSGGVFNAQNDASIYYDYGGGGPITFNNAGTFCKSVGDGSTTFTGTIFNNTGTVQVQSGTLSLGSGGTHTGSFVISNGKTLNFAGGVHSVGDGAAFTGEGIVLANGGGAVSFTGLTSGASISSATTLNFSGGSLVGAGKLTVNGIMNWSSSGDLATASLTISSGAYLNIIGTAIPNFTGIIYNSGTAIWTGAFDIRGGGSVFNNLSGGTFDVQNNQAVYYNAGGGGNPIFNNAGTFRKSVGTGTTTFLSATFNNTGTVQVQSGILSLQYGGTHTGSFAISNGKTLNFSGGPHSVGEGATFTGEGTVLTDVGMTFTGTTNGASISSATTFNFSGGCLLGSTGDAGKLTIYGTMNWTSPWPGYLASVITIAPGGVLNLPGTSNKIIRYGKIYNSGLINLSGTGSIGTEVGTIQNNSDGIFDIQTDAGIYRHGNGTQSFINNGILKKSAGTGVGTLLDNSGSFSNAGTVQVDAGTLYIGTSISNLSSGTLTGGTYNVTGILKLTGASITTNAASIVLNGSSSQIVNQSDVNALTSLASNSTLGNLTLLGIRDFSTNASTFTNNGTLNFGSNVFGGSGNFTTTSASTLIIGSPEGITASGAFGNIQSGGTRTFSTAANYTYNGISAQVTGNGLPTQVNNFTMNNSSGLTLTSNLITVGTLTLSSGLFYLGENFLTLGPSTVISGTPSATNMIVADYANCEIRKQISANLSSSFTFPIGDGLGTKEYSPVTFTNFTAGSFTNAYIGVRVVNGSHPSNPSSTDYIRRYWVVTSNGLTNPIYSAQFNYVEADINGTEANLNGAKYNGSVWSYLGPVNTLGHFFTALNQSSFSDFTAGEQIGMTVSFGTAKDWNLLSVPVVANIMSKVALFPNSISNAYWYINGYLTEDTLAMGKGYWLKFDSIRTQTVIGFPKTSNVINLNNGWNLIGTLHNSFSTSTVVTTPPNILVTPFYGYQNGYFSADTLKKGMGYWIKTNQEGSLTLTSLLTKGNYAENLFKINNKWTKIIVTDYAGFKQELYLAEESIERNFELAPSPPTEIMDVRYSSNRIVESEQIPQIIMVNNAKYPVNISISSNESKKFRITDVIDEKQIDKTISGNESISITNSKLNSFKIEKIAIPTSLSLSQNYPNPFNPSTTISYQIPASNDVQLIIYDILGKEIAELVNEKQEAGSYDLKFDASRFASGMYIATLKSGGILKAIKMRFMK